MKPGVTVNPPDTALCSVTANVIGSPSSADASDTVTAGEALASMIVPVAESGAVTRRDVPETESPTVNVSICSSVLSSAVATVKVCVSPALPANVSATVFPV